MSRKIFKTTIVILSEYDPTCQVEIDDLARDAMVGESYCCSQNTVEVELDNLEQSIREFFGETE